MTGPELESLTPEALAQLAQELPDDLKDANVAEQAFAHWIIIACLGGDFWNREVRSSSNNSKSDFFQARRDVRVLHTADLLWRLRNVPGFSALLRKNSARDFESTYFELIAMDMIASSCESIDVVLPSGVKGQDFDLCARGLWNLSTASVEFKCRREPFRSVKSLRSFLSDARSQLPPGGNGVIFCRIGLGGHGISEQEIEQTVANWIRTSTTRVRYVVLCWDHFEGEDVAIGVSYSALGPHGATGLKLGSSDSAGLMDISFMSDIGMRRVLDVADVYEVVRRRSGTLDLGTWDSTDLNWWHR